MRKSDYTFLCNIQESYGQQVLEYREPTSYAGSFNITTENPPQPAKRNRYTSTTRRKPISGDALLWHRRLGHPGPQVLRHLANAARGVRLQGAHNPITTVDCDACGTAKAYRVVRRAPRESVKRAKCGERIAIDFHDFNQGYRGYVSALLFTDRPSGYSWDYYLIDRTTTTLKTAINEFLALMKTQYEITVKTLECDGELPRHPQIEDVLREIGMILEVSAPNTQAQNGGAERVGGVIKTKARAMRGGAKLPEYLWPETTAAATYLNNRTPTAARGWKSPYELFHEAFREDESRVPDLSHLRSYGCKAYSMTTDAQLHCNRRRKLSPRAWIGYLVGYSSSNSYRIWNPINSQVFTTRDVIFNESEHFNGNIASLKDDLLQLDLEEIQATIARLVSESQRLEPLPQDADEEADEIEEGAAAPQEVIAAAAKNTEPLPQGHPEGEYQYTQAKFSLLPTPPQSPPAAFFAQLKEVEERGWEYIDNRYEKISRAPPQRVTPRTSFKAAFLAGATKRIKRQPLMLRSWPGQPDTAPESTKENTGLTSLRKTPSPILDGEACRIGAHWKSLPPLPASHDRLKDHPCGKEFREAEISHLDGHKKTRSWEEVLRRSAKGHKILGCHWVYTYKLDKHGRLMKYKARLVIRGDQQPRDVRETYAATLAGASFRTLVAIANRFDLKLLQYDAVNAFVHADIDEEVYMEMPPGHRKNGYILRLRKALYGLRRSPLLWQRHLEEGLRRLRFTRVKGENCCWKKGKIMFFFYVDDCVFAFPESLHEEANSLIKQLQSKYHLEGGKELHWFLGIEVLRDRKSRRLWLSQSVYIEKLAKLLKHDDPACDEYTGKGYLIPMSPEELLPYEGEATLTEVNLYQRKIGSILYAAVMTRPDVAFAASRLARFNQNPGPKHHKAASRVIRYLLETQHLCLEYGSDPGSDSEGLQVASDASFADNSLDRKSSQAFAMKVFGGLTMWRANKQATVTTSTTEAELLALSQAAREGLFMSRLLSSLHIDLPLERGANASYGDEEPLRPTVTIQCDNLQTIGLVTKELVQLQTRLRHVDIHNHWLRQEVEERRIRVIYTPSTELMADGFTKALPLQPFQRFRTQIGLVDKSEALAASRQKDLEENSEVWKKLAQEIDVWAMEEHDVNNQAQERKE